MSAPSAQSLQLAPGGEVGGRLSVPGDKSISHRALMLGALAAGPTRISGFLAGEDCLATARALAVLGVPVRFGVAGTVEVSGVGAAGLRSAAAPLDLGNSGTAMRLMMGLLAPQPFASTLVGDASLMRRPMERVAIPLRAMGARIRTQEGRPPVEIEPGAPLKAITYTLPVASAQVKSALLLAALGAQGELCLTEPAASRDHTERMLAAFGVRLQREGRTVRMAGGQALRGTDVAVPGDFSSAAFFLVAGCLAARGTLVIENVGVNPTRTGLLEMLRLMGADIRLKMRTAPDAFAEPVADIEVRAGPLSGIRVPESLVPLAIDEFPAFFIAAAAARGETLVRGAGELRVKESDRLAAMAAGLAVLGVEHRLMPDGLWLRGREDFAGGLIDSFGDHRIAMAFAVASLKSRAALTVRDVANVATSFPGFAETARAAGLRILSP
ncbi:MAG TPA: 3-phosphoshikimate 1-carboxyvinyltransferase [Steroidobacteraceae bacterium]|nr:3-phosphoshikimate 1-carboxyvinyltransferase [Steroidobacteraceae bacterium]